MLTRTSSDDTWLYLRLLAFVVLLVGLVSLGVVACRHGVFEQLMADSMDDIRSMGRISEKQPSLKSWMRNAAPSLSHSQAARSIASFNLLVFRGVVTADKGLNQCYSLAIPPTNPARQTRVGRFKLNVTCCRFNLAQHLFLTE